MWSFLLGETKELWGRTGSIAILTHQIYKSEANNQGGGRWASLPNPQHISWSRSCLRALVESLPYLGNYDVLLFMTIVAQTAKSNFRVSSLWSWWKCFLRPSILKNYCGLLPTVKSDSRLLHEKSILPSIQSTKSFYYFVFGISAKKVGPTAVIMYFPCWNLHYLSCT